MALSSGVKLFSRREPDEAVVFIGEPESLSGDIWLENTESHELELRRAAVFSHEVRPAELMPADRIALIPVPKFIRAHQRQMLSVSFDLDSSTPPGTYTASIVVEGKDDAVTCPARIIVTQNYALSIEPDQLVVSVPAGGTFEGEVVVTNEGNVPIDVVPLGDCPLEDPWRESQCRCCCHDRDEGEEAAAEREAVDDESRFGAVTIDNPRTVVEPGGAALVRFVARLPHGLPANMHLRARPRIGIERFSVDVITPPEDRRGDHGSPRDESSSRRSPQKRKRS